MKYDLILKNGNIIDREGNISKGKNIYIKDE